MTASSYRLLGADVSYYTAKIRAYLVHKQLPFVDVLATRQVFSEEILPRVGWPVIPVLIAPDNTTLQDTSEMVDVLETRHPQRPLVPTTPVRRFAALLFELYADEWIKVAALHYRWHYDREFAVAEFGHNNDPGRAGAEQLRIGEKIAAPFMAWLPLLGVTPETIPAIEAGYRALLTALDAHFAHHPYLFGAHPTLADCALYGPFHAHLYRDPNSGQIMRSAAPRVVAWLGRMSQAHTATAADGADTIPPSLLPVWRLLSDDYVPILCAQITAFQSWLEAHPALEIPRTFGTHRVVFGRALGAPCEGSRALFSYDQWMLQRALEGYLNAPASAREAISQFATAIKAAPLLSLNFTRRVKREHFRLRRA